MLDYPEGTFVTNLSERKSLVHTLLTFQQYDGLPPTAI